MENYFKIELVGWGVELLGRNSLLTFVIHVYFAKALLMTEHFSGNFFPFRNSS